MRIRSIRAVTVRMPLDRPIVMGSIRYDAREYVVVEVATDEGLTGLGFGMTRDSPVAQIIDRNIVPLLIGEDPRDTERLWRRVYDTNLIIARGDGFMRALSAVDIALWDLKARAFDAPLWRILGGHRITVPAQVAGCYPADGISLDDLGVEVADYAARGIQFVKIAAGELDHDTSRLRSAREAGPTTALIHDVHWAWRDHTAVLPVVRTWAELGLAAIEDPFPSALSGHIARLRAATDIPLALGEDQVGRWSFRDLLSSGLADIIRVDATTMGGVSEVVKIIAMTSAYGLPVVPHVFPEIHVHLGAAFETVRAVEFTDPGRGYEAFFRLFSTWVNLEKGSFVAPEAPGLGVELDWNVVNAHRVA